MKNKINAYFATLIITICGGIAALTIVRVALAGAPPAIIVAGNEASYHALQKSILRTPPGQ